MRLWISSIFLHTGAKAGSDVAVVENGSESKGNNDKEWDKDCSPSSEEDNSSKSNGVGMTKIIVYPSFMITAMTRVGQLWFCSNIK
jgi:hypothetical protein